jgi:hypothetical protein
MFCQNCSNSQIFSVFWQMLGVKVDFTIFFVEFVNCLSQENLKDRITSLLQENEIISISHESYDSFNHLP